jgi:hypothetical protein
MVTQWNNTLLLPTHQQGSVGAAVQGIAIGYLSSSVSWSAVFVMLAVCEALATLCLMRTAVREAKGRQCLPCCGDGDGDERRDDVDDNDMSDHVDVADAAVGNTTYQYRRMDTGG